MAWALDSPDDANAELGLRIIAWLAFESTGGTPNLGAWAAQAVGRTDAADLPIRTAVLGMASPSSAATWATHGRWLRLPCATGSPRALPTLRFHF